MSPINDRENAFQYVDIDELSQDKDFNERLVREFPHAASILVELTCEQKRRDFLKLLGASLALAGFSCTKMPAEKIFAFNEDYHLLTKEDRLLYASSAPFLGYAKGIVVQSHQGRPTKIEGNALHPASLGTSDIHTQAQILNLYDPLRSKAVLHLGQASSFNSFKKYVKPLMAELKSKGGRGVRIVTETITSPTLANQMDLWLKELPYAQMLCCSPLSNDNVYKATMRSFGGNLDTLYDFSKARVIVSLDHDFLGPGIAQQNYAKAFMEHRNFKKEPKEYINRLYMIESSISITGAAADHRIAVKPSEIYGLTRLLAYHLGVLPKEKIPLSLEPWNKKIALIAKELLKNKSQSMVLAGDNQEVDVHVLVHAINEKLQNNNSTVSYIEPVPYQNMSSISLEQLCDDLKKSQVTMLLIMSANPAYNTAKKFEFENLIKKAKTSIHLGLYENETAYHCQWHLPESHFLECFSDLRAFDGTVSMQQPLITPLYETRSALELLAFLLSGKDMSSYEILKSYWQGKGISDDVFEQSLHDGLIKNSSSPSLKITLNKKAIDNIVPFVANKSLEMVFRPDPTIVDGRYANNAWLQELPKPILQLCWDNALILGPNTAKTLNLKDEVDVLIEVSNRKVKAPVLIVPGHPENCMTAYFGYGRKKAGVGSDLGYDAYEIFDGTEYFAKDIAIKKLPSVSLLARTNKHHRMEHRHLVRWGSLLEFKNNKEAIVPKHLRAQEPSLLPDRLSSSYAWAMVIDLSSCIGCNTCSIACQAENNIPVVGKEQVYKSREMHWLRVDRYFEGTNNPRTFFQPVLCMQCEKAPCELVCPTAATNHSQEGLNQMVYNRCVGTRYCSNNCPYKVRRFNFFQYSDMTSSLLKLRSNPQVTIRSRGVMEKCTYCVQRIEATRIIAEKENRKIHDKEIVPACAQACPTQAITFGNKNDSNSEVANLRANELNYSLLNELGTMPRTTYLAKIVNSNPRLKEE